MKNKSIGLFVCLTLTCLYINAQKKYEPGYIVTISKDTLSGYIASLTDAELTHNISFKHNESSANTVDYSTEQLQGFGFSSGRIFKRMSGSIPNGNTQDTISVFAKRLVEGKVDLYVWRKKGTNGADYFMYNNESIRKVHLTKPRKNEVKLEGSTYNATRYKYIGDLNYVKHDQTTDIKDHKKLNYGENSFRKDIIAFNKRFEADYPINIYKEPRHFNYNILVGLPFSTNSEEKHFRIGMYRDKTFTDKTATFSYFTGIIYHHWSEDENSYDTQLKHSEQNFKWQMLNIVPFGFKFQAKSKRIIPYGYLGVGAAILVQSDHIITDYKYIGDEKNTTILPTVNTGIGLKIKVNNNFILTEITPTMNGVFFNAGYSF